MHRNSLEKSETSSLAVPGTSRHWLKGVKVQMHTTDCRLQVQVLSSATG